MLGIQIEWIGIRSEVAREQRRSSMFVKHS